MSSSESYFQSKSFQGSALLKSELPLEVALLLAWSHSTAGADAISAADATDSYRIPLPQRGSQLSSKRMQQLYLPSSPSLYQRYSNEEE